VPAERSGKQWYYSGNSVEKKYSHAGSPGCEVVEKAGIWLGKDGTYVLAVYVLRFFPLPPFSLSFSPSLPFCCLSADRWMRCVFSGYESTGACTLDSGKAKNPTAQVCGCMYEGVFATIS